VKYDALADEPMEQEGELRVGVIGVGNMGGALVRGILARGLTSGQNVIVSDLDEKKVAELVDDLGVRSASDSSEVMDFADLIVLAAKPQAFPNLLASIATRFRPEQTIMSIAAGVTTASIESSLGGEPAVVRVMPNLPALVGEGISVFSRGANAGDIDVERVDYVLRAVGDSLEAPEELMDFFAERLEKEDFYMIAGDNEVTPDVDRRRMEWAVNDMIQNRPALSRWHPDYKDKFEEFMKS
jgi:pyrroline-5-carboxylate reductase